MKPRTSVAARFWLGVALPTLIFVFFILFLVFATRLGQGFGPAGVLVLSVFALPVMVLVNCWVLFVNWRSRGLLFAAGLTLPICVGFTMAIVIQAK